MPARLTVIRSPTVHDQAAIPPPIARTSSGGAPTWCAIAATDVAGTPAADTNASGSSPTREASARAPGGAGRRRTTASGSICTSASGSGSTPGPSSRAA